MKNPLAKLPAKKAQKELKQFLVIGYVAVAVSFFVFGFLAFVGLAAGGRSLLLCGHEANKKNPKLELIRVASIVLLLMAAIEVVLYWSQFLH